LGGEKGMNPSQIVQFAPTEKWKEVEEKYGFIVTRVQGGWDFALTSDLPHIVKRSTVWYATNKNILYLIKL
jgi:hypothetical protein